MTKYARDEFDKVPQTAFRQGVHRTATAPSRTRLWPILAVGIAALAIGLVSFLVLPKLGFTGPGSQAATSQEAPLAGTDAPSAVAPGDTTSPSAEPAPASTGGPAAGASQEPGAPATTAAAADKTQPVAVYNAAGIAGLATSVGATVQSDGWQLGQVGNWAGAPQQGSVIFYAGAGQQANAQALAVLLDIPTVVSSTEFQVPLVVVVGPGFQ